MKIGIIEAAERLLRVYGDAAEKECDARISYYKMQGDTAVADGWRRTREIIAALRARKKGEP